MLEVEFQGQIGGFQDMHSKKSTDAEEKQGMVLASPQRTSDKCRQETNSH